MQQIQSPAPFIVIRGLKFYYINFCVARTVIKGKEKKKKNIPTLIYIISFQSSNRVSINNQSICNSISPSALCFLREVISSIYIYIFFNYFLFGISSRKMHQIECWEYLNSSGFDRLNGNERRSLAPSIARSSSRKCGREIA